MSVSTLYSPRLIWPGTPRVPFLNSIGSSETLRFCARMHRIPLAGTIELVLSFFAPADSPVLSGDGLAGSLLLSFFGDFGRADTLDLSFLGPVDSRVLSFFTPAERVSGRAQAQRCAQRGAPLTMV